LPTASDRLKVVFDLSSVGPHFNGTNEMGMAIIGALCERHASKFDINVICALETFKFHNLDRHKELRRHNVDLRTAERFAIGIQFGQPFTVHAVSVLEDLAVINIFGMLDTISDDCGYLSITHRLESLWGHVARHANGLFFNSKYSEQAVLTRFPDARNLSRYARLLPTKLTSYSKAPGTSSGEHVLIMGNHFAHKASDATAEILKSAFPTIQFVVLGRENGVSRNVRTYRAGTLSDEQMESLYCRASIVVLPSHVEGFGLGLVHALAARKVVVARDIPATREILSTYKRVSGVHLYASDKDVARALSLAMTDGASQVNDDGAQSWDDWADGFADFCVALVKEEDIFDRLKNRIQSGDMLRRAELLERLQSAERPNAGAAKEIVAADMGNKGNGAITDEYGREWRRARHVKQLLGRDGEEFVYSAYVTLFNRLPDSDGLVNYLTELQSGVSKLEIVARLRNSSEGQRTRVPLSGYRSRVLTHRLRSFLRAG
jgi:hypothetical protein